MQIKQSFLTGIFLGIGLGSLILTVLTYITTGRVGLSSLGVIIAGIFVLISVTAKKKTS